MKNSIFSGVMCFLISTYAFAEFRIETNLTAPRNKNYSHWCTITFPENHSGYGPNQPPSMWSKKTIKVPVWATGAELTAMPASGNISTNSGGEFAMVHYTTAVDFVLLVLVEYWSEPWKIYVGWASNAEDRRGKFESECVFTK